MRVVTIARRSLLPQAILLGRSLRDHHPDWPFEVVLLGDAPASELPADIRVTGIEERIGLEPEMLLARHDRWSVQSVTVCGLLRESTRRDPGPIIHLPPTAWVAGDLQPLADAIAEHGAVLAPRCAVEPPRDGLEPSIAQLDAAGRIPPDLVAIDGSERAERFLSWWEDAVERMLGPIEGRTCYVAQERRRWLIRTLELAPARLTIGTLDPRVVASAWNLHEISRDGDLSLIDFAGFEPDRRWRLSPASSRVRLSRRPVLAALVDRYADELLAAGWADVTRSRALGQALADGGMFDELRWTLHAHAYDLGAEFADLFSPEGTEAFNAWLGAPIGGVAPGIARFIVHVLLRDRPDVVAAFPALDGQDPDFVEWCRTFGRDECGIPERFLPPPPVDRHAAPEPTSPTSAAAAPVDSVTAGDGRALGVRVTGYLGHTLGLGAAARGYVQALAAAGVPVSTVTVALDHLVLTQELSVGYGQHAYRDLAASGGHAFELLCINPDELPQVVRRLGGGYFRGRRIGVWGWETNSIPERWGAAFGLVDEIWVYSQFMADNFNAVVPLPVIPLAPPVEAPSEVDGELRLGVPDGFLFLFVFDYLSTIRRKNPRAVIEAFRRAFSPGEGPQLLIKTINAPLRPLAEEELLWAAGGRPDIHLVDRSLSLSERDALVAACDCYVSLHRSEGFGLTMAEAMAVGKPVIATNYSGNLDFMNEANSFLVDHSLTRVGADCEIYPADGEWAEPSVEHAAAIMQRVYTDRDAAAAKGEQARADILRTLSPAATGAAMRERLLRVTDGASGVPAASP